MKRYKPLIFILSLITIVCLNLGATYSYFTSESKTDTQSIVLGNLKVETDNTSQSSWRYVPIPVAGNNYTANDSVNNKNTSGALEAANLRPGDAFEKDITITNIGSLNSRIKITKGELSKNSLFKMSVSLKEHDMTCKVSNDVNDKNIWYVENLQPKAKVSFTVRLELPVEVTNKDLDKSNIRLSNDALQLLDITATQWNNTSWSE
ncbi:hypothetical protein CFOLD11_40310 [Clostridium folliculivorans]|uniref:Alternate signal-mediated exported protein, CPF_0494 family n=1 Tax=Clostridium folliculivorans TaxID=2886038 RepID=A0A9W5Y5P1_9CLOT|nr:hypothetical protein [Clostridium folliculivorans]GKU27204.1 hypothetical protein CFOLD11_40310 [Clostridium folliculivorans]